MTAFEGACLILGMLSATAGLFFVHRERVCATCVIVATIATLAACLSLLFRSVQ